MSNEPISPARVLREALARTPLPMVLTDAEDRVVFANQPACSALGLAARVDGWESGNGEVDIRFDDQLLSGNDGWHQLGRTEFGVPTGDERRGKVWATLSDEGADTPLTRREREILGLVATGLRTEEIAGRLTVSPETVKSHVHNAMQKLRAHTRSQAVAIAISTGQVSYSGATASRD